MNEYLSPELAVVPKGTLVGKNHNTSKVLMTPSIKHMNNGTDKIRLLSLYGERKMNTPDHSLSSGQISVVWKKKKKN